MIENRIDNDSFINIPQIMEAKFQERTISVFKTGLHIYSETLKNYCKVSHTTTIDFMIGVPIY